MSALLVPIEGAPTIENHDRSPKAERLDAARRDAWRALGDALMRAGIIRPTPPGVEPTPIHILLKTYEHAEFKHWYHLELQVRRLRQQLENVLSADAFTDPDARRAVLTTVNRMRKNRLGDSHLYSPAEQDLIASYRRTQPKDRQLFRLMLHRLGAIDDGAK